MRGKHPPKHKISEIALQRVKNHIESFPRIESHYCRKRTRRQFLHADLSISKIYELYREYCEENQQPIDVKFGSYIKIFNTQYNLSFFKPKKDTCRVCEKYKNLTEEEKTSEKHDYQLHIKNKDLARLEKEADKTKAKNDVTYKSFTFDLQAVLYSPCSNVSSYYYTHKMCTYNLTVND